MRVVAGLDWRLRRTLPSKKAIRWVVRVRNDSLSTFLFGPKARFFSPPGTYTAATPASAEASMRSCGRKVGSIARGVGQGPQPVLLGSTDFRREQPLGVCSYRRKTPAVLKASAVVGQGPCSIGGESCNNSRGPRDLLHPYHVARRPSAADHLVRLLRQLGAHLARCGKPGRDEAGQHRGVTAATWRVTKPSRNWVRPLQTPAGADSAAIAAIDTRKGPDKNKKVEYTDEKFINKVKKNTETESEKKI